MTGSEFHRDMIRSGARSFCEPLWLPGWSDRSIWGYDEPTGSFFAQLWSNGDFGNAPTTWIGALGGVASRDHLATEIVAVTGRDMKAVNAGLRIEGHDR